MTDFSKNDTPEFELVGVASGAMSLRSLEFRQTFHPVTGPMGEAVALHVEQQRLKERVAASGAGGFVIWDVGFGAAANAIAAVEALKECGKEIHIHSFDKTTASMEFALLHAVELGYVVAYEAALRELLSAGNTVIAAGDTRIQWQLHRGDFREQIKRKDIESPRAILYDPYSSSANPEMWSLEHFSHLRNRLPASVPCLLTNYTRSTAVRATLLLAGFFVGEGCRIGEKEESTVASNDPGLIERPLDARWLERVRRSTNSAPLRETRGATVTISEEDWYLLLKCPQFLA